MNAAVPLTRFLDDTADIVLADGPDQLNTGCFLARNTPWAADFLRRVYAEVGCIHHPWWENAAVMASYNRDPDVRRRVAVVPGRLFNAIPSTCGGGYERGDFVAHFAGHPDRVTLVTNYAAMAR